MKEMLIVLFLFLFSFTVSAKIYSTNGGVDFKLPTQKLLERATVATPATASTAYVISAYDGDTTGAAVTITSGFTQPDVARVLIITPAGTTADVAAGNVTVTGKNIYGKVITEDFAFLADASTATTGTKAFKSITSIKFPIEAAPYGATWSVGVTDALGLNHCLAVAGDLAWTTVDGAFESTRATCTADVDEVEKNVCDPNTAMNGAKSVQFYYVQNYRCSY